MRVLVIINIKSVSSKAKLDKKLLDLGFQLKSNIYECDVRESQYLKLKKDLERFPFDKDDYILFYPLCQTCIKNAASFGPGFTMQDINPPYMII